MIVLVIFSQRHVDFRIAEFKAICSMFSITVKDVDKLNTTNHAFVLCFESYLEVRKLLSRSILIKYAIELFAECDSYAGLHKSIEATTEVIAKYDKADESFAIRFFAIGRKKKLDSIERIKRFLELVPFNNAPVSLQAPKNEFYLVEEYNNATDDAPTKIYFGKLLGEGRSELKTKYNLRERCYIGNTTMDPELSFIQANLAMVNSGNIVLDPFVGTGGLLLPAAEFGAFVVGTEINYLTAKAQGRSSRQGVEERDESESIQANFKQYNTEEKLMSILIADSSKHLIWNFNAKFDAIVADPPYGVREKATKTVKNKHVDTDEEYVRYQQKEEYDLESAFCDLLNLAAHILANGGRVSFWYPVILENYCTENLPQHPVMSLISNCEQLLTRKTSRRLLTYRKQRDPEINEECKIFKAGVSHFRSTLFGCN